MIDQTAADLQVAEHERAPAKGRGTPRPYMSESLLRLRENRFGTAAGVLILVLALVALAAPLFSTFVTHHDPARQQLAAQFLPPGRGGYPLGADELGRDTLTRLIYGARVSLGIGFLTVGIMLSVGALAGLLAGYFGGLLDDLLMRVVDIVLAFPAVFLYILMAILFRPSVVALSVIIASVAWANVARLVRGEVLALRNRDFMLATRSIGAGSARLMFRHLLPNVMPVLIVAASLYVGQVILIEAALDFLGLGIQQPTASWGNMLSDSQVYFVHSAWLVIFPGLSIFGTVLATNIFGNAVRDAFDPRLTNAG